MITLFFRDKNLLFYTKKEMCFKFIMSKVSAL